ncbi:serine hydrolase domain-containing protein [Streptomyces sp. 4N509B]|uniref:serine hydrolase domain-containing protein n=1 Tax=Streptomyces sp. 4N509B TaxID=3457413 RepID=UPI003FCF3861
MTTTRRTALGLMGAASVAAGGVLATAGSAHATASAAARAGGGAIPRELRPGGAFDQRLAEMADRDAFSGTALIAHGGRTVLTRSHGMADRARSVPNGPDTLFCLGSITKLFTSIAVAQLVEANRLAYHERVGTYLDGFPDEVARNVTLHHLLTHTSGMGDHHTREFWETSRSWDSAQEVMDGTMAIIRKAPPLAFPPGSGQTYSNSAYVTLGAIVEAVSGQPFHRYVRENVFEAAGMTDSDYYTRPEWQSDARLAHPHALQPSGERRDTVDNQLFVGSPAGGSFSSGPDMVALAEALLGGRLLSLPFAELVLSGKHPLGRDEPGTCVFQAYGPLTTLVDGHRVLSHSGGSRGAEVGGVSCLFETYPDLGWTLVLLGNYDDMEYGPLSTLVREAVIGAAF